MDGFTNNNGVLHCDGVSVDGLAKKYGSPLFVYSASSFRSRIAEVSSAYPDLNTLVAYSVKSCSSLGILSLVKKEGAGADIVSGGELFRCINAGIDPKKIVFAGVGKTDEEINYALECGIRLFNVESMAEMQAISRIATGKKVVANAGFRINPDIDANTHEKTTTGKKENKFGIPHDKALDFYMEAAKLPNIVLTGIDIHLGSPIYTTEPYVNAINRLLPIVKELISNGIPLKDFDMGGGIAIVYNNESPFTPSELARDTLPFLKKTGLNLIIEPGRYISGNSAILVSKVVYIKKTDFKNFVILDAGMNDLIRPAFYGSYHAIKPVVENLQARPITADIVGPICESSDCFAKDRELPEPSQGDYLAMMSSGAYGFSMSSNYNSRRRPAEVLVDNGKVFEIRKREDFSDLIKGECVPD